MRSPYLAVVDSYRRWFSVLLLLLFSGWIASFAIPDEPSHTHPAMFPYGALPLLYPRFVIYGWFLGLLGVLHVAHLKEMLGGAISSITPGLARTHFLVAGIIVALFTVVAPLSAYWGLGFRGAAAAIVALALVAFAVAALITFRWSWTAFFVFYSPVAVVFFDRHWGRNAPWMPSAGETSLLFALATVCLATLAFRFANFHEEMPEYSRRFPLWGRPTTFSSGAAKGVGGTTIAIPLPRNFRSLQRMGGVTSESLIERALHWHAVWRTIWAAVVFGGVYTAVMLGILLFLFGPASYEKFLVTPMNVMMSAMPAMFTAHPSNRRHLALEWTRPYSRAQYIQAVGLVLVLSCVVCWLLVNLLPVAAIWIIVGDNPMTPQIHRQLLFSLCAMPGLFSAFVWPHKRIAVLVAAAAGFSALAWIPMLPGEVFGQIPYNIALGVLVVIGIGMTVLSYRRWLNVDIE